MSVPLAERMRPQTTDDIAGQRHLLGKGKPLSNIIASGNLPNLIFYGPSGIGKTTLAKIIAKSTDRYLAHLNGTTASTADIKDIVSRLDTFLAPNGVLLYLDEIQYFNKKQQQTLLEFIETGAITLIASTTENPYFYIYNAILSRSTVFEFKPVNADDIKPVINRAFEFMQNERNEIYSFDNSVTDHIANTCGGDVRKALNAVELCALSAEKRGDIYNVSLETAKLVSQKSAMKYDREGDEHYDILSAYQKSMRGSDPNAALHYLARLLEAGDLPSACRRLLVCACEDVGLAYPQIIPIVKACVDAAMMVGLPEAGIPLADAVVLVSTSPKSNTGCSGLFRATADIQAGNTGSIPRTLQNKHFDGEDNKHKGQFYKYPHDFENGWVKQQYLPDKIKDAVYYEYGNNKSEQAARQYWENIMKDKSE